MIFFLSSFCLGLLGYVSNTENSNACFALWTKYLNCRLLSMDMTYEFIFFVSLALLSLFLILLSLSLSLSVSFTIIDEFYLCAFG